MKYLLVILCMLGQLSYIYFGFKEQFKIALIAKTLAVLSFIAIAVFAYYSNISVFNFLILIGMLFDGLGDILLGFRNILFRKQMFLLGTFAFFVGHVFYITALYPELKSLLNVVIILDLVVSITIYIIIILKIGKNAKSYHFLGILYILAIAFIFISSLFLFIVECNLKNVMFSIGSFLFLVSDLMLIVYNFISKITWLHLVYSSLYFLGQSLIALSLFY